MRRLAVTIACTAALLGGCTPAGGGRRSSSPPLQTGEAVVVDVVDGDTIRARTTGGEEAIRLIGADTPETVDPHEDVQCFGPEAADHTRSLLPGGTRIRLERDVELRDRFGRLLAYVYRADDGLFVNEALLAGGYAHLLTIPPNVAYLERLRAAATLARADRQGLWSLCPGGSVPP